METCPFPLTSQSDACGGPALLALRPEDVGFDSQSQAATASIQSSGEKKTVTTTVCESDKSNDPLVSILFFYFLIIVFVK